MTSSTTLRMALVGAATAVAAALPLTAQAAAPVLNAEVGPGFTITLKDSKGAAVKSLKAGAYTIKVADKSNIHNFQLSGPGVSKDSGVAAVGSSTWNVTLKKGTYKFVCTPHATIMKGSVTVS